MGLGGAQDILRKTMQLIFRGMSWPFKFSQNLVGSTLEWSFSKAKTTVQKALVVFITLLAILWLSVISYASFYNLYIPSVEISKPVHLGFSVCPDGTGICSFPSANVTFGKHSPTEEVLGYGQKYRVILELEMPDCSINHDLGMFMVVIRMYDRYYYVSAESKRSVMTKFRSFPVRLFEMLMWTPFYFVGFMEEKNLITVEFFSAFIDDYYHPSVGATIEVQNHKIQIYSCHLKLFATFSGLKYLVHVWPITSAVIGIWCNMCFCFIYICVTIYNKRSTFDLISQSLNLSLKSEEEDGSQSDINESKDSLETSQDTELSSHSTQTKENEDDDAETYDLPLVQEPADFPTDDADLELMTELRHRRLQ